eukprot:TRINITY_DN1393_c0_g1_i1.p1 TRINITY_DN1393_c0_g1~~TRINITY_DN1393_c0_g1_i1.p1  ORF type:complete len:599 (-),score=153.38 TRINITY_DN1393_c0_g1_i1:138-1697(-)
MIKGRKTNSLAAKKRKREISKQQQAVLLAAATPVTTVGWVSPKAPTDKQTDKLGEIPPPKKDLKLKDGTKLRAGNVLKLYPDLYNRTSDFGEDGRKCRAFIGQILPRLLSNPTTRSEFLTLPQDAIKALLQYDNLSIPVEYDLLCLAGAWCDKQLDSVPLYITDAGKNPSKTTFIDDSLFADVLVWHKKQGYASSTVPALEQSAEKINLAAERRRQRRQNRNVVANSSDTESISESSASERSDDEYAAIPPPPPLGSPSTPAAPEKNKIEMQTLIAELPAWKKTEEYKTHLKKRMNPLMDHIRFPIMGLKFLERIEESGLVDLQYLTEAYKYLVMSKTGRITSDKNNERFRKRVFSSLFTWDKDRKGANIVVTEQSITKTSTCSHSSILTKQGMTRGVERWSIKLKTNAGCYSAIGIATSGFSPDGNILGVAPNSWGYAMYVGMGNLSARRIQTSSTVQAGTVVSLEFDRDDSKITVYENSVQKGVISGVSPPAGTPVHFVLTICHNTPQEEYTLLGAE